MQERGLSGNSHQFPGLADIVRARDEFADALIADLIRSAEPLSHGRRALTIVQ